MHDHTTAHGHEHHHHEGVHASGADPERSFALLGYLVEHNKTHAHELQELAFSMDGQTAQLIDEAVALYNQANDKLEVALTLLNKE